MSEIQAQSICLYMHQTLDQTDSGPGFARIVVSEIEAPSILVIRSELIVNLARRGRTAVRNDNSTELYRHRNHNVTGELLGMLSGDYGKGEEALQPLDATLYIL